MPVFLLIPVYVGGLVSLGFDDSQPGTLASKGLRGGRFIALVPAFQGAGLAIGPSLAGAFPSGGEYYSVNAVPGLALAVHLLFILPFTVRRGAGFSVAWLAGG